MLKFTNLPKLFHVAAFTLAFNPVNVLLRLKEKPKLVSWRESTFTTHTLFFFLKKKKSFTVSKNHDKNKQIKKPHRNKGKKQQQKRKSQNTSVPL